MVDGRFEKACAHFDAGEYFEAHEVWEELWNEATGARHAYLQGLIQVAVALHHASEQNWNGARKLMASSLGYLERGRPEAKEVDVDALRDLVLEFELSLQRHLKEGGGALAYFVLPRREP